VQKSVLLAAIQKEIQRHDLSYFVDEPPSVTQGGRRSIDVQRATARRFIAGYEPEGREFEFPRAHIFI